MRELDELPPWGAVNGARTRDPQLGKLMLYQLSYYRKTFGTAKVVKIHNIGKCGC